MFYVPHKMMILNLKFQILDYQKLLGLNKNRINLLEQFRMLLHK